MARTADHEARRQQIIGGVRKLALGQGLRSVTVAGAATTAGVSTGLVQHYYSGKDDLLADTFTAVRGDIEQRVDRAIERAEARHERIEQMMVAAMTQLLPLDRLRRQETYLTRAFAGLALDNDRLANTLVAMDNHLTERAAQGLSNGKECGEVDTDTDTDAAALSLLALTDGLAGRLLMQPGTIERQQAQQVLRSELARLCPGTCTRYA